jgi:hypothetical protein
MRKIFVHNVLFRLCAPLILGVLNYLLILLIHNSVASIEKIFSNQELYVLIGLSYISFEGMRVMIRVLDRVGKDWEAKKRIVVQLISTLAVSLVLVYAAISAYFRFAVGFSISTYELYTFLVLFGTAGLFYNLLYFSHFYLQRENKTWLEEEKKLHEKIEADFSMFRSEINPDLLYDSLENLILTIHHNTDQAEEQIDYLAGIYRYSLVNRQKELVTYGEELKAAESLLSLLNYHHHGQLNILPDNFSREGISLIPGSLMIAIDTIVRNTLVSQQAPLVLRIYLEEEDDYLVLQHTINDKLLLHEESLNAFTRLQRSYTFFSDKPFVQVKAGRENFIKFPVIRVTNHDKAE